MQYIIMNKEENRIQVESGLPMVFSGELCNTSVTSFLVKLFPLQRVRVPLEIIAGCSFL